MDNLGSFKFPFDLNISLSGYPFLLMIFVLLTMLTIFLKRKISNYMIKRGKLIEMSDNYERKRQCRNDLRVSDANYNF